MALSAVVSFPAANLEAGSVGILLPTLSVPDRHHVLIPGVAGSRWSTEHGTGKLSGFRFIPQFVDPLPEGLARVGGRHE
jgi:hypothetical protein